MARTAAGLGLVAALAVAACAQIGPAAVETGRNPYNLAIQNTNDEQLLLNLVRLKYRDTPFFLEVSSVATQYSFAPSAGVSGDLVEAGPGTLGVNAGIAYEESPTVTYAPLHGNEFVERLLSPIPLDTILLLYHSGWSIERVLRVCVQRMNRVKNAPSASGPTPDRAPEFEAFQELAKALRVLQVRDALTMGYEQEDEQKVLVMRIDPAAADSPEAGLFRRALGLREGATRFTVSAHHLAGGADQIGVGTRSLMGVLFYLSQSVEAPPRDEERGAVTVTRTETGAVFDWREVTGDLLRIHSSPARAGQASVAVDYRGHRFYIDDADLQSKSTFSLLAQLFALQAGRIEAVQPMFTLPLGR